MKHLSNSFKNVSFAVVFILSILSVNAQTAVDAYGQLSVSGTKMVTSTGSPVQLQGMSLFWSNWQGKYYDYNTIKELRDKWCINVIRAAMAVDVDGQGYKHTPAAELAKVETVIDAAIDLGIYVIVDFHSHAASSAGEKELAKTFFGYISEKYGDYPNIIYEPFNEPIYHSWSNELKPFYENDIIPVIRANDPDNIIVVGTPMWDQDVDVAAADPITGQSNIAYTLHYYAASHKQDKRNQAQTAINAGLCLFVTEYGICSADGNGFIDEAEANTWWDFLSDNDISHANWAISDKDEKASALKEFVSPDGNWNDSDLRESGTILKAHLNDNCPDYGNPPEPTYVDIPAKLEAEDYSSMSGVQKETTEDIGGGQNVGYIESGDYIEFMVNAKASGTYDVEYRLASDVTTGSFDLMVDNVKKHAVTVESTGGWQTWVTVSKTVTLTKGNQTIKILATGDGWNINYIDFIKEGIVDCDGVADGTASIDECGVCSGGETGVTPNSTCEKDCNGDVDGTALVDNCGVCAGGETGIVAGESCAGDCNNGLGLTGAMDDLTLENAPYHLDGGVFAWGEDDLAGDDNPNFQAFVTRNTVKEVLEVEVTQGQANYVPFGFSFGSDREGNTASVDLTNNATLELSITNTSSYDLKIAFAIQDVNDNVVNVNPNATGEPFGDAYLYEFSGNVDAGKTSNFIIDFEGALYADYDQKAFTSTFDFTKVSTILITPTNQSGTGAPLYEPYALSGATMELFDFVIGDCAGANNLNNTIDCNGELGGVAYYDACEICAGGDTEIEPSDDPNNCIITSTGEVLKQSLLVYPNPTTGELHIYSMNNSAWELYDSFGALVLTGTSETVDVSNLNAGVYMVKVDGQFKKVIKQ